MFGPIITNFAQNVHFDKLSNEFETGSCWIKNEVTRANLLKNIVNTTSYNFGSLFMTLGQNVFLGKISDEIETVILGQKSGEQYRAVMILLFGLRLTI